MQLLGFLECLSLLSVVAADGLADLSRLQSMTANISSLIENSVMVVNNTIAFPPNATASNKTTSVNQQTYSIAYARDLPTASSLQELIYTIGAVTSNVVNGSVTSWLNGQQNATLDAAYFNYIDEIPNLAQGLTNRGRAWHNEANQPVYFAIQSLTQAVHTFSYALTTRRITGQFAIIRTISAGNKLINSQLAWSNTGTLPGRR